jgi:hypothetical protein
LDKDMAARQEVEARLTAQIASVVREADARHEASAASLRGSLARVRAEAESSASHARRTAAEHLKAMEANKAMADNVATLTDVRNKLYAEVFELNKRVKAADALAAERERLWSEQRAARIGLEGRLAESEEKVASLAPWKSKALEAQQAVVAEQVRAARLVDEALKGKGQLETDKTRLAKLLKLVTIATFVRETRLRKALAGTHELVSDMLLHSLEESMASHVAPAAGSAGATAMVGGVDHHSHSSLTGTVAPTAYSSAQSAASTSSSVRTSFKAIQRRKKAYLTTLLSPHSRPRDILASLHDEVTKLRAPLEDSLERVAHWKRTSEAFFARNIELSSALLDLTAQKDAALEHARALAPQEDATSSKSVMNDQAKQQLKHVELQRANAALRAELEHTQHQLQHLLQHQQQQLAATAVTASSAIGPAPSAAAQALLSASSISPPIVVLPLSGGAGLGERSLSSSSLSSHSSHRFDGSDEKQAHGSHQLQSGVTGANASRSPALLTLTPRGHAAATADASSSSSSTIFVVGRPSPSSAVRPTPPAGTASLRPIYYAPHQPQPPQPLSSSPPDASVNPQLQRQMTDLQRERYNAAVASGGGSSLTPRKAAAAAVIAAAAPSHTTPPRRPEANGFHLPHAGGSPILLTYNKPAASARRTPR